MKQRKVLRYSEDNKLTEFFEEIKEKKKDQTENNRTAELLSVVSQMGFSISLPIVGGAIFGRFLDDKFNTSPRLTLSLIFVGLFLGIMNIFTTLKKIK